MEMFICCNLQWYKYLWYYNNYRWWSKFYLLSVWLWLRPLLLMVKIRMKNSFRSLNRLTRGHTAYINQLIANTSFFKIKLKLMRTIRKKRNRLPWKLINLLIWLKLNSNKIISKYSCIWETWLWIIDRLVAR